jgi:serine protease Do
METPTRIKTRLSGSLITLIIIISLLSGIIGGLVGFYLYASSCEPKSPATPVVWQTTRDSAIRKLRSQGPMPASFADVADAVLPAVVNIDTVSQVASGKKEEDFFRRLLPFSSPAPRQREGLGSGMIIRSDGIILTNEHVIRDADRIQITLADDRHFTGRVLGRDGETDIAVVKIDAVDLPTVAFGDSAAVRPGDWAIAVGNPLGLNGSVSVGVISALNRPIQVEDRSYNSLIQTDVAIIPGNSGGPLVNTAGEVIGINNAIQIDLQQSILGAAAARVGFAVPIDAVADNLDQLIHQGRIVRSWVGISMRLADPDMMRKLKLPQQKGILVERVIKGGPAEQAGLQAQDIIIKVDGKPTTKMEEVQRYVRRHKVGDTVVLTIKRPAPHDSWRNEEIKIKTAEMPSNAYLVKPEAPAK